MKKIPRQFTEKQERIIAALKEHGELSTPDLAKEVGFEWKIKSQTHNFTFWDQLNGLRYRNILASEKRDGRHYWRLMP